MRVLKALHLAGISALCLGAIAMGSALHLPAMAAQVYQQYLEPDTTCTSSSPCTTTTNNGSGPASANTSVGGTALTGTTKFSSSTSKFAVGVLGADASSKGTRDIGVEGTSVSGIGAKGTSKSGIGVSGVATTGIAIQALGGAGGTAVEADSTGANLFTGFYNGALHFTVDAGGDVDANGYVSGSSAVFFDTCCDPAVSAGAGDFAIEASTSDSASTSGVFDALSVGGPLYEGFTDGTQVFEVDASGNVTIAGMLYTAGACNIGCIARGSSKKRVVSYAPRESQPTMEDFGEGQLVNGQARVALDPAFANVIDQNANYLVFAMPEGDCNGLFIAERSKTGFVVRELRGGHSSIGFEYRIVAKPFGDHSARLPTVVMSAPPPNPKPAQRT